MDIYQKNSVKQTSTPMDKDEVQTHPCKGSKISTASNNLEHPCEYDKLMEAICDKANLTKAYHKVVGNKGAAGIDNMRVDELKPYLCENWSSIKHNLLCGKYEFSNVRVVEIPKPFSKEKRKLGIPTVVDRFVSQAILQVLQDKFDPTFDQDSYGFRPNKSAHQAISKVKQFSREGFKYVVDIDLRKFFDTVNHDKLMSELAKTVKDKRLLTIIRSFLNTGNLFHIKGQDYKRGMAQGNPLSPLLSNILLNLLDIELRTRGHKFCRYADDCNIFVKSPRAGDRVKRSITIFIERKLKLEVNQAKSAVDRMSKREFLGFSLTNWYHPKIRIGKSGLLKFKMSIRKITRSSKGVSMKSLIKRTSEYMEGWISYYGICETPSVLKNLEAWVRRRLRSGYWRQWKTGRRKFDKVFKCGNTREDAKTVAGSRKNPWRLSRTRALSRVLSNKFFEMNGLPKLVCKPMSTC
jgi:RNA-directed DNA polymerase